MIVGNGDIARTLIEGGIDREDIVFFASGVSKSTETDKEVYHQEEQRIRLLSPHKHWVYFSSLCIYYSDTVYAHHKRSIEQLLQTQCNRCTIVRLGNITWGNNPHTIINFFKAEHAAGRTPELQDTYRYLVTKDEFIHWMKLIPVGVKNEMNIPGEMVHVKEIWRRVQDGKY